MTDHPFGRIVVVIWSSAAFNRAGPPRPTTHSTVGWIAASGPNTLVIASELTGPLDDMDGARLFTSIPHEAVERIVHIKSDDGDLGGGGGEDDAPVPTPPDTPSRLASFYQEPSCN